MIEIPKTQYARGGDGLHIAYQMLGDGPVDLIFIPGWYSHVESQWDEPLYAHFLRRLATFTRLITFDKRGVGLSDPVPITQLPTIEEWSEDLLTVMDAVGSRHAVIFGATNGAGALAMVFAATHPGRISGLVLFNTFARLARAENYPAGIPQHVLDQWREHRDVEFGSEPDLLLFNPSLASNERVRRWVARHERLAASPGTAMAMRRMVFDLDVRTALPVITTPTLVLHRAGCAEFRVGHGRYLASNIAGARYVELPGVDSWFFAGDADRLLDEIEEFATGVRRVHEPDRVLATVLFTDVVDSTAQTAALGDRRWRELLDAHDERVRVQLSHYRGREIRTTGDGLLATFDGPARAIRSACGIRKSVRDLGLDVRAGLHTGELDARGNELSGIAVHIAQRVEASAAPGEVLVSRTVVDLVAGSGIEFEDRGEHELKGVPGNWRLFAVKD
jgi:class 3 adenylate cyclase